LNDQSLFPCRTQTVEPMSTPVIDKRAEIRLPRTDSLEAGVQIGDFRIERRLGAGGMGIVYQARQLSLNRPVALKVLGQALTQRNDVARFQREAQAAARLKHPSIAQVYYIGQDRHVCYLAMELIHGVSLRRAMDALRYAGSDRMGLDTAVREELGGDFGAVPVRFDAPTEDAREQNPTPAESEPINPYLSPAACEVRSSQPYVQRAAELIRDAARALAHAHAQGVIHRDIKPDNLLLDLEGQVHIIDFGVARFFEDQAVTYTGQLVGTPLYMSPEQVTGRGTIDARTDLYSLGLVLYELLALRPPIEATNREHLLRTIVTKPLAPISWCCSTVPADLERIVHRATQKDPDLRYATAEELAADLDRFLAGQPVAAPHYHFRLDEREIVAARPSQVVLAAFVFFALSFFAFLALGSFSLFSGIILFGEPDAADTTLMSLVLAGLGVAILAVGVVIGRGVLAARTWARWLGVIVSALLIVAALGGIALIAVGINAIGSYDWKEFERTMGEVDPDLPQNPAAAARRAFYAVLAFVSLPLLAELILGATALWALLCRATGQWFRFARDIRREHALLKERLAA
jgi:serine/threonine protein kinase